MPGVWPTAREQGSFPKSPGGHQPCGGRSGGGEEGRLETRTLISTSVLAEASGDLWGRPRV